MAFLLLFSLSLTIMPLSSSSSSLNAEGAATTLTVAVQQQQTDKAMNERPPPNRISSHVLDIAAGHPARGVKCTAYKLKESEVGRGKSDGDAVDGEHQQQDIWELWGQTETNEQGRIPIVHPGQPLSVGIFKVHFNTKEYFQSQNRNTFYPFIEVAFRVEDPAKHYHVPITLSNFGYSTYKGQ